MKIHVLPTTVDDGGRWRVAQPDDTRSRMMIVMTVGDGSSEWMGVQCCVVFLCKRFLSIECGGKGVVADQ